MGSRLRPNETLPPVLALAWGLVPPGRRGRPPRHSLDEVVAAAVALADEDGLVGVSMPRLAHRLGMTQNALYRYVTTKDDLLVLMGDAASPAPPALDSSVGWQANARTWTLASLVRYITHPWLLDLRMQPPSTPNALLWLEAFLDGMADADLGLNRGVQCALLLNGYARSIAALSRDVASREPAYSPSVVAVIAPLLRDRGATQVAEFLQSAAEDQQPAVEGVGEEVDFGLERIIEGIQQLVDRR
jgi:AcrR family transcriptional regulator